MRLAQGRGERTLKDYAKHVRQFFREHPEAVDEKKLCDAVIEYMSERIAPATYNLRLSNLKNFFEYCRERGLLETNPMDLFSKKKVNPMIGAAGISAFPMASRVVHKMGLAEDNQNHLLMHAAGANVAGQIASVIAGGVLLSLIVK